MNDRFDEVQVADSLSQLRAVSELGCLLQLSDFFFIRYVVDGQNTEANCRTFAKTRAIFANRDHNRILLIFTLVVILSCEYSSNDEPQKG